MICEFCGKVRDRIASKWTNYELGEEYKICDVCVEKIKAKHSTSK